MDIIRQNMLHKFEPVKILLVIIQNTKYIRREQHFALLFRSIEFYIYMDNFKKQKEHKNMCICL